MLGLGTIAEYNFFILGALQAKKLSKTSGACFAGHPVCYLLLLKAKCLLFEQTAL